MVRWKKLFRCVGKAVLAEGLQALVAEIPFGGFVFNVARGAWNDWHEDEQDDALRDALNEAAAVPAAQARAEADVVAADVATGQPAVVQQKIAGYLAQLPAHVQRSIRLQGDPTGTTIPAAVRLNEPADLLPFLPPSLPQFRPGDPLPGRDPWWLVRPLGAGGFGEVWLAQNGRFDRILMAVKFCHDAAARERLLRHEAELAHQATRPGVVPLKDLNLAAAPPWIGFEYIDGSDLASAIVSWHILPLEAWLSRALTTLRQLSETVGLLHRDGVVHRDIKPSNVLLRDGEPLLTDLGLGAVSASHSLAADRTGQLSQVERVASYFRGAHTPLYASPQQKAGGPIDPRDDVHALGVTAYQMLTAQVASGVEHGFDDDLRDLGVPDELIALIRKCVHRNPDRRPKDGDDLAARLVSLGTPRTKATAPAVAARKQEPNRVRPGLTLNDARVLQRLWAEFLGRPVTDQIDLGGGELLRMNLIPPGTFMMGGDKDKNEKPAHEVEITRPFWMSVGPVTVGQFRVFAATTNYRTDAEMKGGTYRWVGESKTLDAQAHWRNPGFNQADNHPVVCVSWNDAIAFTQWLSQHSTTDGGLVARLPTEAEWEYACRGGGNSSHQFGIGDGLSLSSAQANFDGSRPFGGAPKGDRLCGTTPVGHYKLGNGFGLFDMHGSVWEWCEDWCGPYRDLKGTIDPVQTTEPSNGQRVMRGGSFLDYGIWCRSATRSPDLPTMRLTNGGFRLVISARPT